eukprot:1503431-Pyramimonas_sp.AAC.1
MTKSADVAVPPVRGGRRADVRGRILPPVHHLCDGPFTERHRARVHPGHRRTHVRRARACPPAQPHEDGQWRLTKMIRV